MKVTLVVASVLALLLLVVAHQTKSEPPAASSMCERLEHRAWQIVPRASPGAQDELRALRVLVALQLIVLERCAGEIVTAQTKGDNDNAPPGVRRQCEHLGRLGRMVHSMGRLFAVRVYPPPERTRLKTALRGCGWETIAEILREGPAYEI